MPCKTNKRNANSNAAGQPRNTQAAQQSKPANKAKLPQAPGKPRQAFPNGTNRVESDTPRTMTASRAAKSGDGTGGQPQNSQQNTRLNKSRGRSNKAGPARKVEVPKLELPEGYTPPKQQSKKSNQSKKKISQPSQASAEPKSQSFRAVKPWALDPKYPRPQDGRDELHSFNYDRFWHSFGNKDVQEELLKALARGGRAQLPPLFKDSSGEELHELRKKYVAKGQSRLFQARVALRDIPDSPGLLLAKPPSTISPVNDDNELVKILNVPELGKMIVGMLSPSIGDLTALAGTCKRAAAYMQKNYFAFWDFRSGVFPTDKFATKTNDEGRVLQENGIRQDILVITPISDEDASQPHMADFKNLMKLNNPTATITRCLLLDVTKLKPLLDVIKRHPRPSGNSSETCSTPTSHYEFEEALWRHADWEDAYSLAIWAEEKREEAKNKPPPGAYIRLDFFPFFFRGPSTSKRLGSYGVTYNEPTFHTPKAVFGLILQCWDLAREVGMDLVSDSSSFWSFVRQLPGPDILWATKARDALLTREYELAARTRRTEAIRCTFADDITAALIGDNYQPGAMPHRMARFLPSDHHAKFYWRTLSQCQLCQFTYPKSLFPIRLGSCWSCKMERYVNEMEDSHLRLWQHSAIVNWTAGLHAASSTVDDLLTYRPPTLDRALEDVRCADWAWGYSLRFQHRDGMDPYSPPGPATLGPEALSLARWRWNCYPATEPVDLRKGGPQCKDPCKQQLSVSCCEDEDYGAESMAHFNRRWRWTKRTESLYAKHLTENFDHQQLLAPGRAGTLPSLLPHSREDTLVKRLLNIARNSKAERLRARDIERRAQNKLDKEVYKIHHHFVEDCLWSLFTPANLPFNLDKPMVNKVANPREYEELMEVEKWNMRTYGSANSASYW
ncbi:hypothetical protein VTK56DRAFT_604 [Thermocarpiscus australiensis]